MLISMQEGYWTILFRGGCGCTQASAALIHGRKLGTMFWCARKLKSSLLRQTLTLILVEEWTSHAFIAGTKKFLPLSGKNSFTTYNRRKVANDAFYANHSQKQVGTDPFFNEKFSFFICFEKAIFGTTNVCRFYTWYYLESFFCIFVFNLVSRYLSTIALFSQEKISSILFFYLSWLG